MKIPSIKYLNKVTKILSKIMKIHDWEIEIVLLTDGEMQDKIDGGGYVTHGLSERNVRRNYARVYLNKEKVDPNGWYETLVHELLHVQETTFIHATEAYMDEHASYYEDIHESYVDTLTRMFIKLYPYDRLIKENQGKFK